LLLLLSPKVDNHFTVRQNVAVRGLHKLTYMWFWRNIVSGLKHVACYNFHPEWEHYSAVNWCWSHLGADLLTLWAILGNAAWLALCPACRSLPWKLRGWKMSGFTSQPRRNCSFPYPSDELKWRLVVNRPREQFMATSSEKNRIVQCSSTVDSIRRHRNIGLSRYERTINPPANAQTGHRARWLTAGLDRRPFTRTTQTAHSGAFNE